MVRLDCLSRVAGYLITISGILHVDGGKGTPQKVDAKMSILIHVKRLKAAYYISQPSGELSLSQCYMSVASYVRKTSGEKHDIESMNRAVEHIVSEVLRCNSVVSIL